MSTIGDYKISALRINFPHRRENELAAWAETYLRERKEISMDDPLLKAIGTRMMDARKKAGYTQEQLGEVTGLSIKMISAAENGHKAMRPANIIKISESLGISTDYLLKGEDTLIASLAETARLDALTPKQRNALQRMVEDFLSAFEV